MQVQLRARSFGELIGLCFSVAAGHFGLLFMLALCLNVPAAVLGSIQAELATSPGAAEGSQLTLVLVLFIGILVWVLTAQLLQGTTIRIVASSFTGDPARLGDCLRFALRKLWSLLGYGLMTGLIIGVGALMCLVPAFIFTTWYYLGTPALMVEDLGAGQAMRRSKELSRGHRWEILGYAFVTAILFQGIAAVFGAVIVTFVDPRLAPWVSLPINSLLYMPLAVAPVVYYFNLRVIQEGFDLEKLSSIIRSIGQQPQPGSTG